MIAKNSKTASVLVIDPLIARIRHPLAELAEDPAIEVLGHVRNLNEAYNITEARQPDLVVVAAEQMAWPQFPMFAAMLDMLQIDCLGLSGARPGPIRAVQGHAVVSVAEIEAAGGFSRFLSARHGLRRATTAVTAPPPAFRAPHRRNQAWKTVVIGSSAGGIEALLTILTAYREDCPPTLIVQHIRAEFLPGLVQRLDRHCAARVRAATAIGDLCSGQVLLAPGNAEHLMIVPPGTRCRLQAGAPVSGHRPSVDMLFHSAAKLGGDVVGVILSGLGRDGAEGLAAIRKAGGSTIGQNKASSVVYGMPRAAADLGAVERQLHLDLIGPAILEAAASGSKDSELVFK